jgi:hypothetical protein
MERRLGSGLERHFRVADGFAFGDSSRSFQACRVIGMEIQQDVRSTLRIGRDAEDFALVLTQDVEPMREVSGAVDDTRTR